MIYNYPFFYFPHTKKYSSNYYSNNYVNKYNHLPSNYSYVNLNNRHNFSNVNLISGSTNKNYNKNEQQKSNCKYTNGSILGNLFNQSDRSKDEKYFEVLGIKLYYDDILLICLIFFLYKEDVKDTYLFIALILLLLS